MSLDVYLHSKVEGPVACPKCHGTGQITAEPEELFEYNITHNLAGMASEAGIYEALWRPEEAGIYVAGQLIEPLTEGLTRLKAAPERFKKFDAENGWGVYANLVEFVEHYLEACRQNPEAMISVSR